MYIQMVWLTPKWRENAEGRGRMASKERLYELWMLYYTKVSHEQAIARATRHLLASEFMLSRTCPCHWIFSRILHIVKRHIRHNSYPLCVETVSGSASVVIFWEGCACTVKTFDAYLIFNQYFVMKRLTIVMTRTGDIFAKHNAMVHHNRSMWCLQLSCVAEF